MKFPSLALLLVLLLNSLGACQDKKSTLTGTQAGSITTSDSSMIVPHPENIDSATLDPAVHETALQQDPPSSTQDCNLSFILLSNPDKNHHIYQVKDFQASSFKCWSALESHATKLCGNMPCQVSYIELINVQAIKTPPYYLESSFLKNHGIGHFEYKTSWWELRGARIWDRGGKGFEYYNSNRY